MEYEIAAIPSARFSERVRDVLVVLLTDTENGLSTELIHDLTSNRKYHLS